MNDDLKHGLEKLTRAEQEQRLNELAEKLGIAHPKMLEDDEPKPLDVPAYEEYTALTRILGFD